MSIPRTPRRRTRRRQDADLQRMLFALCTLVIVTLGGAVGFMLIEGWSFWRAFYFTIITITTVGYGDEGISQAGQLFAALLLIGGIGAASYSFALIVQTLVTSSLENGSHMQKEVDGLTGHTIVCGYGRMGRTVCHQLADSQVEFVVLEKDPQQAELARDHGYLAVEGAGSEDEVLLRAGILRASHLISAIANEGANILISLTARELAPGLVILARADTPEDVRKLERAGATHVVAPLHAGGLQMADMVVRPQVAEFLAQSSLGISGVTLDEVVVERGSQIVGRALRDYGTEVTPHLSFVALVRDGGMQTPPPGSEVLRGGDLLIVAGKKEEIEVMLRDASASASAFRGHGHSGSRLRGTGS